MALPVVASAAASDIQNNLQCGTTLVTDGTGGCTDKITAGSDTVNKTITTVINFFSAIVGIVSVIMIIYGGFKYISSGGDSGNVQSAKNTIIYAVIGLVVVAMAQFIVQFVLNKVINAQ
ncbi:MAG TPA: pilin [Patescibacteria group bacterium]|nr:pilin [Patescibacteria group bacterium]